MSQRYPPGSLTEVSVLYWEHVFSPQRNFEREITIPANHYRYCAGELFGVFSDCPRLWSSE